MSIFYIYTRGRGLGYRPANSTGHVLFSLGAIIAIALAGLACATDLVPGGSPNWPQTALPPARGNPDEPFYAEMPITRWSTVPLQTYSAKIPVGLVAFHGCGQALGNEGIEKVEFIANNGEVATVRDPSPNPETGLWEWWAYLNPGTTDGIVEVRAIIYPYSGQPRVLQGGFTEGLAPGQNPPSNEQSIMLWSNKSGTYTKPAMWVSMTGNDESGTGTETNPFRTIGAAVLKGYQGDANFGRIYLGKGTYPMHRGGPDGIFNTKGWLAIEAAPGLQTDDVIVGGNKEDGSIVTRYRLVCFRNLTFDYSVPSTHTIFGPSIYYIVNLWFDQVVIKGASNASAFSSYFTNINTVAFTGTHGKRIKWMNWNSGPVASIVTGVDVSNTSGDVFSGASFIRDWTVRDTVKLEGQHPDIWQSYGQGSNRILMDGKAVGTKTQLIFLDGDLPANRDVAMVNIVLAITESGGASHIGKLRHLLLWNIDLQTQPLLLYAKIGPVETFGAVGCIFAEIVPLDGQPTNTFKWDSNQFTGGVLHGVNGVLSSANHNENYDAQTPAQISKRTVRWAMNQQERLPPYQCGAYASSNQSPQIIPSQRPGPVQGLRIVE